MSEGDWVNKVCKGEDLPQSVQVLKSHLELLVLVLVFSQLVLVPQVLFLQAQV
jgi:hypothetical protein